MGFMKQQFIVDNMAECPTCRGLGYIEQYLNEFDIEDEECPECWGQGEMEVEDE